MRIVICDDEKAMQNAIARRVQACCPEAELFFCSSGEELLRQENEADLVFLDIQMPGINGMEAARELRKTDRRTVLVFVTALEEYVFQAFDVGAFHYLVKPFSEEKFREVLKAAASQYEDQNKDNQSRKLKEEKYLLVQHQGSHRRIRLNDLICAEVYNRKVVLHVRIPLYRGKEAGCSRIQVEDIVYYGRLSELEAEAGEDFFRTHRAYLVHFKYIEKYDARNIYLEYGCSAMMAKKNYPEFVRRFLHYNKYLGNGG